MVERRKLARPDVGGVRDDRVLDALAQFGVALDEARLEPGEQADEVFGHQYLSVARGRRADADGRDRNDAGDLARQGLDRALDDRGEGPCLGDGMSVFDDSVGFLVLAPERAESARGVDRLWQQADVRQDRNAALGQELNGLGHLAAAFELDAGAADLLHDARRVAEGQLLAFLVRAERHVDDDAGLVGAAHDGLAVGDHHVEGDAERAVHAIEDHAERVAHQQKVAVLIEKLRRQCGIGRQTDDGLAALHRPDLRNRDLLPLGLDAHHWTPENGTRMITEEERLDNCVFAIAALR